MNRNAEVNIPFAWFGISVSLLLQQNLHRDVVVTNDGATALSYMVMTSFNSKEKSDEHLTLRWLDIQKVEHPVASLMVQLSQSVDQHFGDGLNNSRSPSMHE